MGTLVTLVDTIYPSIISRKMQMFEFHYKDSVGKVKWELVSALSEPEAFLSFEKKHESDYVVVLEVFEGAESYDFSEL